MDFNIETLLIEADAKYKILPHNIQEALKRHERLFYNYEKHRSVSYDAYILFQSLTEILCGTEDKIDDHLFNLLDELNACYYFLIDDDMLFQNIEMDFISEEIEEYMQEDK